MAKRVILYYLSLILVLTTLLGFMPASEVKAGTETYNHIIPFTITDTSGVARTNVPVIITYDVDGKLVASGLTNATATDTYMDSSGAGNSPVGSGTAYDYLMASDNFTAVIPSLPAYGSETLNLYTGYSPTQTSFPIITGGGNSYITTAVDTDLDIGSSGNYTWSGYFNPDSIGYLLNNAGADTVQGNGSGNLTATVYIATTTDTDAVRPNAAGASTQLTPSAGNNYACAGDGNDGTYVGQVTTTYKVDLYNIPNHTTESGTINSITIYFRLGNQATNRTTWAMPAFYTNSTLYDGTAQSNYGVTLSTKSQVFTLNPVTSNPWTWDEFDNLQIGVSVKIDTETSVIAYCTDVWVVVNYEALSAVSVSTPILSAAEHTFTFYVDGVNLGIVVDGTAYTTAFAGSVLAGTVSMIWNTGNIMPSCNYIEVNKAGTRNLLYQPNAIISGTTLPDRETGDGANNGVITWGTNSDMTITGGDIMDSGSATSVGVTSFMMQGELTYIGTFAAVYLSFEYGLNTDYGYFTSETSVAVEQTYSVTLTGVSPNTTYHYRAVAKSGVVYSYGADITVTTTYSTSSQGSTTPLIQRMGIFRDYQNTGDALICAEIVLTYPPYYPAGIPSQYFQMQLIDIDGSTLLGATPIKQWGDRPAAIYLNAATVTSLGLVDKSAYQIRIANISSENITNTSDTMDSGDWYGSDLTMLDDWCIGVAWAMSLNDGTSITDPYLKTGTSYGTIITDTAGGYFTTGIPNIAQIRPNLFGSAEYKASLTTLSGDIDYNTGSTLTSRLGTGIVTDITTIGDVFNLSADNVALFIILGIVLLLIIYTISQTGGFGALGALILCVPIIMAGMYLNMIKIAMIAVVAVIMVILIVRQFWWKTT